MNMLGDTGTVVRVAATTAKARQAVHILLLLMVMEEHRGWYIGRRCFASGSNNRLFGILAETNKVCVVVSPIQRKHLRIQVAMHKETLVFVIAETAELVDLGVL